MKKLGLFYFRNQIIHIKDDDGEAFDLDHYRIYPKQGKIEKESKKITYGIWANTLPYSSSIKLDSNKMQSIIVGIL